MNNNKSTKIGVALAEKTKDELRVIAKRLKLKGYSSLVKGDLVALISDVPDRRLQSVLCPTWWDRHHNHCYGFAGIASLFIGIVAMPPMLGAPKTDNAATTNAATNESSPADKSAEGIQAEVSSVVPVSLAILPFDKVVGMQALFNSPFHPEFFETPLYEVIDWVQNDFAVAIHRDEDASSIVDDKYALVTSETPTTLGNCLSSLFGGFDLCVVPYDGAIESRSLRLCAKSVADKSMFHVDYPLTINSGTEAAFLNTIRSMRKSLPAELAG